MLGNLNKIDEKRSEPPILINDESGDEHGVGAIDGKCQVFGEKRISVEIIEGGGTRPRLVKCWARKEKVLK